MLITSVINLLFSKEFNYLWIVNKTIKIMKAILIDAKNREVKEVTLPNYDVLESAYPLMGEHCRSVESILYLNNFDLLLGDEEAYYNGYEYGFIVENFGYVHGNGLVIGSDADGENADVNPYLLSELKKKIEFADKKIVDYMTKKIMNSQGFTITPIQ